MTLGFCSSILLLVKLYKCCRFFIRHVFHRFPYILQIIRVIQLTKPAFASFVLYQHYIVLSWFLLFPNRSHLIYYRACCLCYNIVTWIHTPLLWQLGNQICTVNVASLFLSCCVELIVRVLKLVLHLCVSLNLPFATCSPDCDLYNLHMFSECMAWHAD